jgi:hypothetical protein
MAKSVTLVFTPASFGAKRQAEYVVNPRYAEWAAKLLKGEAIRFLTSEERPVCFIPGKALDMPEHMLTIACGGRLSQGYIEIDVSQKAPNMFFLKQYGFPLIIGGLICRVLYSMFPHLHPLSAEDIESMSENTQSKENKILRLTSGTTSKRARNRIKQATTSTPTDHAHHSSKRQRSRKRKESSGPLPKQERNKAGQFLPRAPVPVVPDSEPPIQG